MRSGLNRRQFIGGVGGLGALLIGCRTEAAKGVPVSPNQVSRVQPQTGAPRLAFTAQGLVSLLPGGADLLDPQGAVRQTIPLEKPQGVGVLSDGSLVIIDQPAPFGGDVRLRCWRANSAEPEERRGFVNVGSGGPARVLPGADANSLWVASYGAGGALSRITLQNDSFTVDDYVSLPDGRAAVLCALDGGAAWGSPTGLSVRNASGQQREMALPPDLFPPSALASAGPSAVWMARGQSQLFHVQLGGDAVGAGPASPQPEGLIVHLAACGDLAATLEVQEPAGASTASWAVSLYDPRARRWRKEIAAPKRPDSTWIAMDGRTVAVGGPDGVVRLDV